MNAFIERHQDKLLEANIPFEMLDNAFVSIDNPLRAQQLSDALSAHALHQRLERWAQRFCPVMRDFRSGYHWSFMQAEYATDAVFHRHAEFQPLYDPAVNRVFVRFTDEHGEVRGAISVAVATE